MIKDFPGASIDIANNFSVVNNSSDYQRVSFSVASAVANQSLFAFRLDDFNENDSVRFDNVLVTGTLINAIPEPSSLVWLGLTGLAAVSRRRRS